MQEITLVIHDPDDNRPRPPAWRRHAATLLVSATAAALTWAVTTMVFDRADEAVEHAERAEQVARSAERRARATVTTTAATTIVFELPTVTSGRPELPQPGVPMPCDTGCDPDIEPRVPDCLLRIPPACGLLAAAGVHEGQQPAFLTVVALTSLLAAVWLLVGRKGAIR